MPIFGLSDEIIFPPPHLAEAHGLLAVGGDLSQERLLAAYGSGIFPWYSEDEPILWWSPDPRLVLYPGELKVPRRLARMIRKGVFQVTMDTAFDRVILSCAQPRSSENKETWIVPEMIDAYRRLHLSGYAHSVEAWHQGELAGGLYGVSLGRVFCGESMFTRVSNASKVAFTALVRYLRHNGFQMIDCQIKTDHLMRFGAREIPRKDFLKQLKASLDAPTMKGKWRIGFK